jgi:hypothetical protein
MHCGVSKMASNIEIYIIYIYFAALYVVRYVRPKQVRNALAPYLPFQIRLSPAEAS